MDQENIFKTKIKDIEEEIERDAKKIEETNATIDNRKAEIERLAVLRNRLIQIHRIRVQEDLGNCLRISVLANKVTLKDFLDSLADVLDFQYTTPISSIPITNLTMWQALFLFHGDLNEMNKDEATEDPEWGKEEKQAVEQ